MALKSHWHFILENNKKYIMKQIVKKWAIEKIKEHPQHKEAITDLWNLCLNEIDEGGSEPHEFQLFESEVEQLIKN
jgi:hypothetical protein